MLKVSYHWCPKNKLIETVTNFLQFPAGQSIKNNFPSIPNGSLHNGEIPNICFHLVCVFNYYFQLVLPFFIIFIQRESFHPMAVQPQPQQAPVQAQHVPHHNSSQCLWAKRMRKWILWIVEIQVTHNGTWFFSRVHFVSLIFHPHSPSLLRILDCIFTHTHKQRKRNETVCFSDSESRATTKGKTHRMNACMCVC